MDWDLNIKRTIIRRGLFFTVLFAIIWCLTSLTPLIADDFNYAFTWADEGIGRIDNFYLVYTSMQSHRMWTHGRVFAQGWVSLFMMWPKWVFNLANAAVLTLLFGAVYHFFLRNKIRRPLFAAALVAVLYWVCMPVFGQVFLWLDGTCNYSWGAALGFLLIELTLSVRTSRIGTLYTILLLPLSFAVGAWSEHVSFAVLVILCLFWLYAWIREKRFPVREALILFVCGGGYLFLMLAPSMLPSILKKRAKEAADGHVQNALAVLGRFWWVFLIILAAILVMILFLRKIHGWRERMIVLSGMACWIVFAAALVFGCMDYLRKGFFGFVSSTSFGFLLLLTFFLAGMKRALKENVKTETVLDAVFLAAGGISALVLFAFAMYFPARGFCAPVVFIGIASGMLWFSSDKKIPRQVMAGLAACFVLFFAAGLFDILSVYRQAQQREEAIGQALLTDGVLVAEPYRVRTKYSAQYGLLDLMPDESWPNDYIKEYYQLRDIIVVPADTES